MKSFLLLSLFSFSFLFSFGQQNKIDSLNGLLKADKDDTTKVKHLLSLSKLYEKRAEYEKGLSCGNAALQLSNTISGKKGRGWPDGIAQANNVIGHLYQDQGKYDSALEHHFAAVKISEESGNEKELATAYDDIGLTYGEQGDNEKALEKYAVSLKIRIRIGDKEGIAQSYNNIGVIYQEQGMYDKALENAFAALKIHEETGNKNGIALSYNNIGIIYDYQGKNDKALENYSSSLRIMKEIGSKRGISMCYNNIGIICLNLGQYDKALESYTFALHMKEEIGDKKGIAHAYINIGTVYEKEGKIDKALDNYVRAQKITREIGDKESVAVGYNNIGIVYLKQNKIAEAKNQLQQGLDIAKQIGSKEWTREIYKALSLCDSASGDWKGAYQYQKLYKLYNDSVFNTESSKKTAEMNARYAGEKKESQIKLLQKDKEKQAVLSAEERKRQFLIIYTVAAVLLLVAIFAFVMFNRFRITQKQKRIIERQKEQVEEHRKEIIDSITYAKRLQQAILPSLEQIKGYFPQSFLLYKPKDIVAGDFYWMEHLDNVTYIAAADCTGHGVPGAMVSIVCSNALNRSVKEFNRRDTGMILDKTRELVLETFAKSSSGVKDGMDISLLAVDRLHGKVFWSGANNQLWYIENGELKEVTANKQPIGQVDNPKPFTTHTIELVAGSTFYLMTDGYPDQFGGPKGKKYKYKPLQELLLANCALTPEQQHVLLSTSFQEWKGNLEQVDDVTIIGICI